MGHCRPVSVAGLAPWTALQHLGQRLGFHQQFKHSPLCLPIKPLRGVSLDQCHTCAPHWPSARRGKPVFKAMIFKPSPRTHTLTHSDSHTCYKLSHPVSPLDDQKSSSIINTPPNLAYCACPRPSSSPPPPFLLRMRLWLGEKYRAPAPEPHTPQCRPATPGL